MIVAGTGHRPDKLGGYSTEAMARLVRLAMQSISGARQPKLVISGMALGWDTALAIAAWTLGIPYTAAVPFKGQESRWPKGNQEQFNFLLSKAKEIVYVCDDGYAPWKMQKRNEWMIDHCDTVLALWNGSAGGTANCIGYAEKIGKPVINVWETYINNTERGIVEA